MREASTRATHLDDPEALAQRLPALLHDLLVDARLAIVRLDRSRGDLGNLRARARGEGDLLHCLAAHSRGGPV